MERDSMANPENLFSLLDLIDNDVETSESLQRLQKSKDVDRSQSKSPSATKNVKDNRGQRMEYDERSHPNSYQQNHGRNHGYDWDNGRSNSYQLDNWQTNGNGPYNGPSGRRSDSYKGNYRQNNNYRKIHNRQGDGYYVDNGQGNGYQYDNGRSKGYQQDNGLNNGHDQPNDEPSDGWSHISKGKYRQNHNYRQANNYGPDNQKYSKNFAPQGMENQCLGDETQAVENQGQNGDLVERQDMAKSPRTKLSDNGEQTVNGDNGTSGTDGSVTGEVSKVPQAGAGKRQQNSFRKRFDETTDEEKQAFREKKAKEAAEERKKMTLAQYEKVLSEKRKAPLEALKTEERTVTVDKDFESMQPIGKKKEDCISVEVHSEKDKLKNKDENVCKPMSINEFLKPSPVEKFWRDGRRLRRPAVNVEDTSKIEDKKQLPLTKVPEIKDEELFPALGRYN